MSGGLEVQCESSVLLKGAVLHHCLCLSQDFCVFVYFIIRKGLGEKALLVFSVTAEYCPWAAVRKDDFSLMNSPVICSFGGR